MFGISGAVKYYYCPEPVNMRKSFDGLAGAMESLIHQNPESGHAFLFFGKTLKMVKILQWDGDGFVLYAKRLERGSFQLPKREDGRIGLSSRELAAILAGIKPKKFYKRYEKRTGN